ncbi:uroporphyrinogen-III synthase [Legionella septentrionalis]|nr:uroporphyrinogen-III synthase [Legionella septentrionalis]
MSPEDMLNGLRILNTRPAEQGKALSTAIKHAGGVCIELPALEIVAVYEWPPIPDLTKIQHAIFTSANAVHYFFAGLKQRSIAWAGMIHVIAIGQGSAAALRQWNIKIDCIPAVADSEHLLRIDALHEVYGQNILLVKGEGGRTLIADTLLSRRANLISLPVYRRILPEYSRKQITYLWQEDAVDIILFSSQQTMQNIFTLFGSDGHSWLCSKPCLVISERIAKEASALGIKTVLLSEYDALLETLCAYVKSPNH